MTNEAVICGVGITEMQLGHRPGANALDLGVQALKLALADAGLERDQVDGLIIMSFGADYDRFLEASGMEVRYVYQGWSHGRFVCPTVQHAAMVIEAGLADYVAIVHGRLPLRIGTPSDREMWRQGLGPHGESPAYGAVSRAYGTAIATQRYFHKYGGSNEDLAPIAVAFRKHASMNPNAVRRQPITIEDHQASRWIVEPLRLFDCCQQNDGGACLILTTPERARDLKKAPVYVAGMQGASSGRQHHNMSLPGLGVAQQGNYEYEADEREVTIYKTSGISRSEIDIFSIYDGFTPLALFILERMGFCGPGEAIDFVKNGRIEIGGELPMNTSGGLHSEGHINGWNLFVELVRQLRGECGERQVANAHIAQWANNLGSSVIFRNDAPVGAGS